MNGLIITSGSINDTFAVPYLREHKFDRVIAVDGGLKAAKRLSVKPDIVVGDFDSVSAELLKEYEEMDSVRFEFHSPIKDFSDTELAIDIALKGGWKDITIMGAIGSRLDHTLANIHIMKHPLEQRVNCRMINENNCIYLLNKGKYFYKRDCFGKYISFLPLTSHVKGVTLKGFKYPLTSYLLSAGSSRCISNELLEEEGRIAFADGILICMETMD